MFFSSWSSLLRICIVGIPAYFGMILLLRISGKRTLSKFNAFDLVVTVAFGSTLSAALVSPDLALSDVLAAFVLLVLLQFVITWSSIRWPRVNRLVKSDPQLLYHRGEFVRDAMTAERITENEILAAIRSRGFGGTQGIASVVLETDGNFSIITQAGTGPGALGNVQGHPASGS